MKKVIWLKTARVSGHNPDNTAKVERITVKLEDGDNFDKFIKYGQLKGYLKKPEDPSLPNEEPRIEKVMENQSGKWVVIDSSPWIEKLNEAMKVVVSSEKIDFKALSEKQAKELDQVKANYNSLEERLKALESSKENQSELLDFTKTDPNRSIDELRLKLEAKANELGIKFRENIGNEKLLERIKEVEPEFEG